ncbi:hypothetical protein C0Q70_03867 [Pomacea canaliculata]|uniref:Hexosyltransferase n=2 Tax=Pomacea canaliculata TaxID=400727 RepID=A0A2T7PU17_POMCA|nr:hypothetical protein C0Q70_03867 [Pomacea canaliculata]
MSGGASYVLSKEALRRLGEKGVGSLTPLCSLEETSEDVAMGQCMEVLGVSPIKTSDVFGRQSFLPFSLEYVLFDQGNCVKSNFSLNPMSAGRECCSQLSISFHYIEPRMMYMIDMLLYRVSVYGRHGQDVALRTSVFKPQVEEIDHKDDQEIFYP